jgi:hypothetical protein
MRVPFSIQKHLYLLAFLVIAILTGVGVESYCGFDLHFFMARDGEHFFMCFFGHLSFFF